MSVIFLFKKSTALFLLAILPLMFFSGCASPSKARFEPAKTMNATAEAKKGNFSFSCNVKCDSYESVSIEFLSPEALSGLSLQLTEDEIKVNAYGITDDFSADFISEESPVFILLYGIRDGIFTARDFTENGDGTYSADIQIGGNPIRVVFDSNGNMSRLDAFGLNFSAEFHTIQ